MLAFHSELTFLVRSFFFVLLGIMAQVVPKAYVVPILGILIVLVVARWLAVRATRWSIRDVDSQRNGSARPDVSSRTDHCRACVCRFVAAKGQAFFFVPAMAFTVVLFTNLFVVVAAVRSKPALAGFPTGETESPVLVAAPTPEPETPS